MMKRHEGAPLVLVVSLCPLPSPLGSADLFMEDEPLLTGDEPLLTGYECLSERDDGTDEERKDLRWEGDEPPDMTRRPYCEAAVLRMG